MEVIVHDSAILYPLVLTGVVYSSYWSSGNLFPFLPDVLIHGEWTVAGQVLSSAQGTSLTMVTEHMMSMVPGSKHYSSI